MSGSKCVVVSYDIGGAELALAFLKMRFAEHTAIFLCDGPAFSFLQNEGIEVESVVSGEEFSCRLDRLLEGNEIVCAICTTGITGYELDGMKKIKERRIPTMVLMEHWTAYRERFGYPHEDWLGNLPDKILFFDEKGLFLAHSFGFPEERTFLEENPCHEILRARFGKISEVTEPEPDGFHILYLSDPLGKASQRIYDENNHFGFDEITVFEDILAQIDCDVMPVAQVVVRRHPMEPEGKYDDFTTSMVQVSQTADLLEDLARADLVIGSFSTAVVTSVIVGRPTVSYIPADSLHLLAEGMSLSHVPEIVSVTTKAELAKEISLSYSKKFGNRSER